MKNEQRMYMLPPFQRVKRLRKKKRKKKGKKCKMGHQEIEGTLWLFTTYINCRIGEVKRRAQEKKKKKRVDEYE